MQPEQHGGDADRALLPTRRRRRTRCSCAIRETSSGNRPRSAILPSRRSSERCRPATTVREVFARLCARPRIGSMRSREWKLRPEQFPSFQAQKQAKWGGVQIERAAESTRTSTNVWSNPLRSPVRHGCSSDVESGWSGWACGFMGLRIAAVTGGPAVHGTTSPKFSADAPGAELWLKKVFLVMGGFMAGAGVLTVFVAATAMRSRLKGMILGQCTFRCADCRPHERNQPAPPDFRWWLVPGSGLPSGWARSVHIARH